MGTKRKEEGEEEEPNQAQGLIKNLKLLLYLLYYIYWVDVGVGIRSVFLKRERDCLRVRV